MKFEILSFLAVLAVYLVRLRVMHLNGSHHVYANAFLDERAKMFIPTMSPDHRQSDSQSDVSSLTSPGSPSTNREDHRTQSGSRLVWDAFLDSGARAAANGIRGCGRAVAVSAFFLLLRILNT
jgi:hypothetical protein